MSSAAPPPGNGIISDREWELIADRLKLPPRQVQMIQAFIAGQAKPETIALTLDIQPSSVKTHIERLYRNLGVNDRVGVVVKVFVELMEVRGTTDNVHVSGNRASGTSS